MAILKGKDAAVYLQTAAASSATTGETMTRVGTTLWYKAPTAKRLWDKDATITIKDTGVAITNVQEYDYGNGRVRLQAVPSGAVTADFSYFAAVQVGGIQNYTLDVNMDFQESGTLGDVAKKPVPIQLAWKLSGNKFWWDTRATYETTCPNANSNLVYTSKFPGTVGNVKPAIVYAGGSGQTLGVTVTDDEITVQLGTNGGGTVTSTAAQVKSAVEGNADAMRLLDSVAYAAGNDGSGTPAAFTHQHCTGGLNSDYLTRLIAATDLIVVAYTDYGNDCRFAGIGYLSRCSETTAMDKLIDQPIEFTGHGMIYYAEA